MRQGDKLPIVRQAYRFALDPTPRQARALARHCGASRYAYNWGLALVKERLDQRAAGSDVDVPWTLPSLRKEWNRAKEEVAPWWRDNSKEAYSSGLDHLARALKNWTDSRSGRRRGQPMRFPRFRGRRERRVSCRFTTGPLRVEPDRHHVTLPRLGRIRTHESTRALGVKTEAGKARIISATVKREAGRWFVAFGCQVERGGRRPRLPHSVIGVDVGIAQLLVTSNDQRIENPRALRTRSARVARLNRQLARRKRGSKQWRTTRKRLARTHAHAASVRRDRIHKTTTELARTHGTIVIEHLDVSRMMRNHRLAGAIVDAGMAQVHRQLRYKVSWHGGRLVEAKRCYPSSRICSACESKRDVLTLSDRLFRCDDCGMILDRDLNAARNLAKLAAAGSGPEALNARGPDAGPGLTGHSGTKREASTRARDETGTAES